MPKKVKSGSPPEKRPPPRQESGDDVEEMYECRLRSGRRLQREPLKERHVTWVGALNLPFHLKAAMAKDINFGPEQPGVLLQISDEDREWLITNGGVGKREIKALLKRLSYKEPLLSLSFDEGLEKIRAVGNEIERQGQEVYVYLNNLKSMKGMTFFNLECAEEALWISLPMEMNEFFEALEQGSSHVRLLVFLNGDPLKEESTEGVKLQFGDILSIYVREGEREFSNDFVFLQSSNLSTTPGINVDTAIVMGTKDGTTDGMECRVLGIPLIVRNIVLFVPTKDLKELRLLSDLWNEEALIRLRTTARVTILKLNRYTFSGALIGVAEVPSPNIVHPLNFRHWKIELIDPESTRDTRLGTTAGISVAVRDANANKWLKQLTGLLDPQRTKGVESLLVKGKMTSDTSHRILTAVLTSLKTIPRLLCDFSSRSIFPPSLALQAVKTLVLFSPPWNVGELILPLVPCIETLIVVSKDKTLPVLKAIGSIQETDQTKFAKLSDLDVSAPGNLYYPFPHLNDIQLLREQSLQRVRLRDLNFYNCTDLAPLLRRYADSIVELTLHFHLDLVRRLHGHDVIDESIVLSFPDKMPKLQSFSFFVSSKEERDTAGYPNPRSILFKFAEGGVVDRIDYSRHFPSLRRLTIWPIKTKGYGDWDGFALQSQKTKDMSWGAFLPTLTPFIRPSRGEDGRIIGHFTGPHEVDIPILLKGKYHSVLDNLEATFPNAVFPLEELATGRAGPSWTAGEEEEEVLSISSSGMPSVDTWEIQSSSCPKCPGIKIDHHGLLEEHTNWDLRASLPLRIKEIIRDMGGAKPFGPTHAEGTLLQLHIGGGCVKHNLLKEDVTTEAVQELLERPYNKPLSILKYEEGQKYTVGKYKDRGCGSQGKFLYFVLYDGDGQAQKGNYFSLECRDQGLWISIQNVNHLCPSLFIYINGQRYWGARVDEEEDVGKSEVRPAPRKLEFGDIITIGCKYWIPKVGRHGDHGSNFLFEPVAI